MRVNMRVNLSINMHRWSPVCQPSLPTAGLPLHNHHLSFHSALYCCIATADGLAVLYRTGLHFFALAYCGSNLQEVARLLKVSHAAPYAPLIQLAVEWATVALNCMCPGWFASGFFQTCHLACCFCPSLQACHLSSSAAVGAAGQPLAQRSMLGGLLPGGVLRVFPSL